MVFNADRLRRGPGGVLYQDRFHEVELGTCFKKIVCARCDFAGFYKYQVQQVRRREQLVTSQDEEARPDQLEIWKTVPRFAEIPQTLKCKRCHEVLGMYVDCIY